MRSEDSAILGGLGPKASSAIEAYWRFPWLTDVAVGQLQFLEVEEAVAGEDLSR